MSRVDAHYNDQHLVIEQPTFFPVPPKSFSRTPWHVKNHKIHIVLCNFILTCDFRTYRIMIHMLAEVSIMTYIGLE